MTVSFSLAFILCSLVLFGLAYILVSSSLETNDRMAIRLKLKEYMDEYRLGAARSIKQEIEVESKSGTLRNFVIRLADARNNTLILKPPVEPIYDLKQLERSSGDSTGWIRLKARDEDDVLDIASARLADGNLLQVGKGPEDREETLNKFVKTLFEMLVGVVLLSLIVGALLSREALSPVRKLIHVLGPIIDTGKVKARIPVQETGDEFEELSIRFNQALTKIDTLVEGMRASMDNIAHDLRTPMTRMRGVAELALQSEASPELYREALSDCLEESEQVLRMLHTLMDISEVETGSVRLEVADVHVSQLLQKVCDLYRGVAEDKNIAVLVNCPPGLTMSGDRNRLLQAVANLLDNALKYTPKHGTVEIGASLRGEEIVMTISDSGIGISQDDLGKIWDRFYRGDKSRAQRGLGLGLSLVRAVIQAHRGTIDVFSQLDKGTRISIQLPTQLAKA
jgi:signal transduction histidine kinase